MGKVKDITGERCGSLVAERYIEPCVWLWRCDCGKTVELNPAKARSRKWNSCGCLNNPNGYDIPPVSPDQDITGNQYERLTAIRPLSAKIWVFSCGCGSVKPIKKSEVTYGRTLSCGCLAREKASERRRQDLTGTRCGSLVALHWAGRDKNNKGTWLCQCDCGEVCIRRTASINKGESRHCGCETKSASVYVIRDSEGLPKYVGQQ